MDRDPTLSVPDAGPPIPFTATYAETFTIMADLNADTAHPTTAEHVNAVGWMRTFSGMKVTPLDLRPEMVDITDIAHALSRIGRFGGHAAGFISVAGHSIAVMAMVAKHTDDPRMILTGLLHDASEAYIGDIIRPIKKHPRVMHTLWAAEERIHEVVAQVFGTYYPHPELVVQADDERLAWEMENIRDSDSHISNMNEDRADFVLNFARLRRIINQGL